MTSLAPLQLPETAQACLKGDVTVHPSAAIAPGVLLQAEEGSQITIAAGACIGMGSILHAYQGKIEIGESANLGAGVLVVGTAQVGAFACIGSSTTLFNSTIQPAQMVPPGSLVGDTSRQVKPDGVPEASIEAATAKVAPVNGDVQSASTVEATETQASPTVTPPVPPSDFAPTREVSAQPPNSAPNTTHVNVYGQAYLNQLLVTLLPHRQALERPLSDDSSPPNDS